MAVNWKELELLLSEMPLEDSYIQKVTEHSVHAFTLHLFHRTEKAWMLYCEIASANTRVCMTGKLRKKEKNAQRFTQYLRAHIIGRKIEKVEQLPFDRAFILTLRGSDSAIQMVFRLYSGSGANVIITDMDGRILELLFRRPQRKEMPGEILTMDTRTEEGGKKWEIREWEGDSFNAFLDRAEEEDGREKRKDELLSILRERSEREIHEAAERVRRQEERVSRTSLFKEAEHTASLLSSYKHLLKKGMESITVDDWETGCPVTIPLDPSLDASRNVEKWYARYHKDRTAHEMAKDELVKARAALEEKRAHWEGILGEDTPLERLKKEAEGGSDSGVSRIREDRPGVWIKSQGWDIVVGRNARENDEILRTCTRGSDIWMHTRDFSGGYVVIKARKDMTVPLPVLLDGASLAIHFSKARRNGKADLYYTQVKYLRRVKDGKTGLVLPTQEKNLAAVLDEERIRRLLGE